MDTHYLEASRAEHQFICKSLTDFSNDICQPLTSNLHGALAPHALTSYHITGTTDINPETVRCLKRHTGAETESQPDNRNSAANFLQTVEMSQTEY